jgi:hypothetical protein
MVIPIKNPSKKKTPCPTGAPLKVICTVTKPKQSTELLGPTPSKYMAWRNG